MTRPKIIDYAASALRRLAVRTGVARLARDDSGSTAVEFAIIAIPFFALIMAILETALVFFAGQALETAVANAARLVRTGQAQQQALTAATFKDKICAQINGLFDCGSLFLDVRKYTQFSAISLSVPIDSAGDLKADQMQYTPGAGGDIVVVRAYYLWPVYLNKLGNDLSDLQSGKHLLAATAAFRNEPFSW